MVRPLLCNGHSAGMQRFLMKWPCCIPRTKRHSALMMIAGDGILPAVNGRCEGSRGVSSARRAVRQSFANPASVTRCAIAPSLVLVIS